MSQSVVDVHKEHIEQNCKNDHKSCKACKTERSSARRIWPDGLETVRRPMMKTKKGLPMSMSVIKKSRRFPGRRQSWMRISDSCKQEMKGETAASQSNGCCFDLTVVEQFITMGATQAWRAASANASHSGAGAGGRRRRRRK